MKYNFDEVIDRRGTNCLKYDFAKERGVREDALPLWIADMDFQTAPEIISRVHCAVEHGIFGYTECKESYFNAIYKWYDEKFNWQVQKNWMIKTPGVVFAIAMAIKAYTNEGDGVLIQQPVYYPFREVIEDNNRIVINSPLKNVDGHYEMDFDDLERKIKNNNVKIFLLCNPHNPVGRVWTIEELTRVGNLCLKYNVKVVSDEIHADFVYPGYKHTNFASINDEFANISVTATAPSKTFNIAGLQISNIFIPNQTLRREFKKLIAATGYSQVNTLGLVACQAAYEEGNEWLLELKDYLKGNLDYVRHFISSRIPQVKLIEPEGTYLIWLDFRELGMSKEELSDLIVNKAKLWLDDGSIFGEYGIGYQRVNIACPRIILKQALEQLEEAIE